MAAPNHLPSQTLFVDWIFTGLGLLDLIILFVARHVSKSPLRWDDYIPILAWILGIVLVCQTTWAIKREGQAERQADISYSKLEKAAMSLMINEALWSTVNTGLRISAWLFIRRIFPLPTGGFLRVFSSAAMAVCCCHGLASILATALVCRPVAANWESVVGGTCGNVLRSYVFMECVGLFLDVVILMVPLIYISKLQMVRRRKLLVIPVFETGWLVFAITGLRLRALRLAVSPDYIWSESYLGMLSAVGCMFGVFLCSVPATNIVQQSLRKSKLVSRLHIASSDWIMKVLRSGSHQKILSSEIETHSAGFSNNTTYVGAVARDIIDDTAV